MSKKKKLPEGIRLLDSGRYQARYPVMVNGRTVQRSAGTFATLTDAKDARSLAIAQRRTGAWVDPKGPNMRLAAWVAEWDTLRPAPLNANRRSFLRVHILPVFGQRRLGDITPSEIQRWVNDLTASGLAPTTVNSVYGLLRQILLAAVDYDALVKSPCRSTIRRPVNRSSEPTPIYLDQLALLLERCPPQYVAMLHLAAWAGLRWQECAALRWENVDLAVGTVTVLEAVKAETRKVGETKNKRTRVVPIAPETVAVLQAHRRDFGTYPALFVSARGKQLDYSSFRLRVWGPLVTKCELSPRPTFHDMRHAFGGHMKMHGLDPQALSATMGHHSAAFTMTTYGWTRPDHGAAVVAAVQAAMRGGAT
jgi:integrase